MPVQRVDVGREGTVVLPDGLRRRYGLKEGSVLIAEERVDGILLRPEDAVEMYSPERKAEFLLGNATNPEEYSEAVAEVRRMGLDPERIAHFRPAGA
jgi:AbrB family looped-hinge helix DNA binding protein